MTRALLVLIVLPPVAASPQDRTASPEVSVTLIPQTRSLQPGTPLGVALRLVIPPGWHIYWTNPGESGLPTTVEWRGPAGFLAGPVQWPYPERQHLNGVTVHAYEGEVILLGEIHSAAGFPRGRQADIVARVRFGVCREVCIARDVAVAASLPVSDAIPRPDRRWRRVAARAAPRIPRRVPGWIVEARAADSGIVLSVAPRAGVAMPRGPMTFFPEDPAIGSATTLHAGEAVNEPLRIRLPFVSEGNSAHPGLRREGGIAPPRLRGVLVAQSGWAAGGRTRALRVDVALVSEQRE